MEEKLSVVVSNFRVTPSIERRLKAVSDKMTLPFNSTVRQALLRGLALMEADATMIKSA